MPEPCAGYSGRQLIFTFGKRMKPAPSSNMNQFRMSIQRSGSFALWSLGVFCVVGLFFFDAHVAMVTGIVAIVVSSIFIRCSILAPPFAQKIAFFLFFFPLFVTWRATSGSLPLIEGSQRFALILSLYYTIISSMIYLCRNRILSSCDRISR